MNRRFVVCGSALLIWSFNSCAIDGHAVNAAWRNGSAFSQPALTQAPELAWAQNGQASWRGALCKYTIQGNHVTRCDTLVKRSQGLAQYPAMSMDGQKVAFFHWGARVSGTQLLGANDPDSVAVVNIDGAGLTNLAPLATHPGDEVALDWPAGDWIYYVQPRWKDAGSYWNQTQREFWRVNSKTKVNQKICEATLGTPSPDNYYVKRFSLSLDATRMGFATQNQASGNPVGVWCFPPPNGVVAGSCFLYGCGSCNASISASGSYIATYGGGWHEQLALCTDGNAGRPKGDIPNADRPTVSQLQSWSGASNLGLGGTIPRWSCNSDKWLNQRIIWEWDGQHHGDNSIACNFVDHQAILCQMSVNEYCTNSQWDAGKVLVANCSGDLFVSGGPTNSWEDVTGQWHAIAPSKAGGVERHAAAPKPRIRSEISGITISLPARSTVEVINSRGRIVSRQTAGGEFVIRHGVLTPGSYIIHITSEKFRMVKPLVTGL